VSRPLEFNEDSSIKQKKGKIKLKKYINRPEEYEDTTFYEYLILYDFNSYTLRLRSLPRLINYFPKYNITKDPENFARVKLILYYLFRDITNLLEFDRSEFIDYYVAYNTYINTYNYKHFYSDSFSSLSEIIEEDD